jgi:hypothetical protein
LAPLGPIWSENGPQNWSKSGPKSVPKKRSRKLQKNGHKSLLVAPLGSRPFWNLTKTCAMVSESEVPKTKEFVCWNFETMEEV